MDYLYSNTPWCRTACGAVNSQFPPIVTCLASTFTTAFKGSFLRFMSIGARQSAKKVRTDKHHKQPDKHRVQPHGYALGLLIAAYC